MNRKVFCIPYAGGSSFIYGPFRKYIKCADVISYDLPGKGRRLQEKECSDFTEALDDCSEHLLKTGNYADLIVFGYSMGGLLAFEAVKKIYCEKNLLPNSLFIAACDSPQTCKEQEKLASKNDQELCNYLLKSQGITEELVGSKDFIDFFLPIIRNDFAIIDSYNEDPRRSKTRLPKKCIILYSDDEKNIETWDEYTKEPNKYIFFSGGHFFIRNAYEQICSLIEQYCS